MVFTIIPEARAVSRVGAITLSAGENSLYAGVIDTTNGFAYFATYTGTSSPGVIVKVRLSDFTIVSRLTMNTGENNATAAVIDATNGYAYFSYLKTNSPGLIVKVKLSDFTRVTSLTLSGVEAYPYSAVIDTSAGYAYFGSLTGYIVKIRLSDFTRVTSLQLNTGENAYSSVIDPAGGYAYFGSYGPTTSAGNIVKIRLSDFTRVGAMILKTGEHALSAVIDPAGGNAYFGTAVLGGSLIDPGRIVKVRLSDFTLVGSLTMNSFEPYPYSAVIDPGHGFAYFATVSGAIVKIQLSDLTRVEGLQLNADEIALRSAVIDSASGFAYFGTINQMNSAPAVIVKVSLAGVTTHAYHPGVVVGNTASYKVVASWTGGTGNVPVPADIQFLNSTDQIDFRVTAVADPTITIDVDWHYRNGTTTHGTATVNVATGVSGVTSGTIPLSFSAVILAAGLKANDHITENNAFPTLNTTTTINVLGVARTVNFLNITSSSSQRTALTGNAWDQASGIPVGTMYTETVGTGQGHASITLISTNIWSSTGQTTASLSITCGSSSINSGSSTTCTVTVAGNSPSGTVNFSTRSSAGSFNPSACTLSNGQCIVTYTDSSSTSTTAIILATYAGDSSNTRASNSFSLNIIAPSSTVTLTNGQATLDRTATTGIAVTITGSTAADGTSLTITTQPLTSASTGVGAVSLANAAYYDVKVVGINDGNAKVCITYASAGSNTTMEYWSGTAWTAATGITVNGTNVCGIIPVSKLAGTNIAVGNTVQQTTPSPATTNLTIIIAGVIAAIAIAGIAGFLFLRRRKASPPTLAKP